MSLRHAYVVRDLAIMSPMGTPAGDAWVLGGRARDALLVALRGAGLEVVLVDSLADAEARVASSGGVITFDSVVASVAVVRRLVAAMAGRAIQAALPVAISTTRLSHLGGLSPVTIDGAAAFTAPLYALPPGGAVADATPVLLPFKEQAFDLPMPVGMIGERANRFAVSDAYMVRIDHWAHVLRLNQLAVGAIWVERWAAIGGRFWFLWRALCGFPWRGGRLVESIRRVHRRARVHHRAHVELSVIEEGAEIGANAVIKASWIGKGARVGEGAIVTGCVLGERAVVAEGALIMGSVLYPDAFASQQKMQLAVLGEGAVAFTGSYFYDINFSGNVRVAHRGKVVDCGDRAIAVCMGPWSRVSGGVWVASGREIPAGALIVQPPDGVLYRIDEELASRRMVTVVDRALIDLGPLPSNLPEGVALPGAILGGRELASSDSDN